MTNTHSFACGACGSPYTTTPRCGCRKNATLVWDEYLGRHRSVVMVQQLQQQRQCGPASLAYRDENLPVRTVEAPASDRVDELVASEAA